MKEDSGSTGLIPGSGRSPGGGHGNPLQYSCLENPHGQRSLAGYSPWGHKESDTTEQPSTQHMPKLIFQLVKGRIKSSLTPLYHSDGKESACNVGNLSLIPGSGRPPGGGHGNPLQYSCLENPHGQRSLAGYSLWGCKESDMTK